MLRIDNYGSTEGSIRRAGCLGVDARDISREEFVSDAIDGIALYDAGKRIYHERGKSGVKSEINESRFDFIISFFDAAITPYYSSRDARLMTASYS